MKREVPYKVIYSNDCTNITTCISPYHPDASDPFRPEMLRETVREVAGKVDAHFIQLAVARVPWYQSKIYPIEEHNKWWSEHYGIEPNHPVFECNGYHRYLMDGGDILQDFIDVCREYGQAPFVSVRLNDSHFIEFADVPGNTRGIHCISRFYAEHPEYRLGTDSKDWYQRNCSWIHPEVREVMYQLIEEQCENYDIDGLELDFQRHPRFFRDNESTSEQRIGIMTGFISRVRKLLDRTQRGDKYRWLCVRIPCYCSLLDDMGIDVPSFVRAGVDMVNVSAHYFTAQNTDFPKIQAMAPDTAMYLEMCHCLYTGKAFKSSQYDNFTFRRVTDEQYYTTAYLAYAQGAKGVSLFNFVYYREHGCKERGPFNEPPFHVLDKLGDEEWLAKQPQHYILSPDWRCWNGVVKRVQKDFPCVLSEGSRVEISMEMASPKDGWTQDGCLRLQTETPIDTQMFHVWMNGVPLQPTDTVSEPYPSPYTALLGDETDLRAFVLPLSAIKNGTNIIEMEMTGGSEIKVLVLDAAVR